MNEGIELGSSEEASAIVTEVRAGYSYVLDETLPRLPSDAVLQPSEAERLVWDGDGWLAVVPEALMDALPHPTRVEVGANASDGFVMTDVDSGLAVRATLVGATTSEAAFADGYAVYPDALEGADVIHRFSAAGVEDFVLLREAPPKPELRYTLELEGPVAGLRLVGRTLEFLDANGTPRLRVEPPYAVDADDRWLDAELGIEGCAFDTDPRPPFDRPVVEPGASSCELTVSWPNERLTYPLLVDPSWSQPASHMITRRWWHGAETLPNGKILFIGGDTLTGSTGATKLCEIWDPTTLVYTATGSMTNKRYAFGWATVATTDDTYVLAAGGYGDCPGSNFCDETERYNTADGTWSSAGVMPTPRIDFPLVVVTDGTGRAFATGGQTGTSTVTASVASYSPSANSWTTKQQMGTARKGHGAVALVNNSDRIIVLGGIGNAGTYLNTGERYTPVAEPNLGSWSATGTGTEARYGHTLTLIASDQVLAVGGQMSAAADSCTATVRKYNPGFNSWSNMAPLDAAQCYHAAAKLEDGKVLVCGGRASLSSGPTGDSIKRSQVYDPSANSWTMPLDMQTARYRHTATLYPMGPVADRVLAAGGILKLDNPPTNTVLWEGEFFTP